MEAKIGINLIVGLGNPGPQYENTRHNVGFWLVKDYAKKQNEEFRHETKFGGNTCAIKVSNYECKLLMPTTFMNLSGTSVRKISDFYKIPTETILVIHDELDFLPGVIRLKNGGGANGHNGVQNIIDHLGSKNFWRLRVGIGKPTFKEDMTNYVLHTPSKNEIKQIHDAINCAIEIIPELIFGNFEKAVQTLHTNPSKT